MIISTGQLADKYLHVGYRKAYRMAIALDFPSYREDHRLFYELDSQHPFIRSYKLVRNDAKAVYSLSELAEVWEYKGGHYSTQRIKDRLLEIEIPIYNAENKGLIYLCDIIHFVERPEVDRRSRWSKYQI